MLGVISAFVPAAAASEDVVLELNSDNFELALHRHPALFVAFHAPWCGHCQSLRPAFVGAARVMEGQVAFGWLDATVHLELANKYGVRGYPTVKLLREGSEEEYGGGRQAEDIVRWLEERSSPPVTVFETEAEIVGLEARLEGRNSSKVIFHASGDEAFLQLFTGVAVGARQRGAWAMRRFSFARAKGGSKLEVFRGVAERVRFEGDLSNTEEVETFVEAEELPLLGEVDDDNFEAYLNIASRGILWLCLAPEKVVEEPRRLYRGLGAVARRYRRELPFLWLDTVEYMEHVRDDLRCTSFPMVVVQLGDMRHEDQEDTIVKYKQALPVDFTPEAVGKFLEDCIAGRVEPVDPIDEEDEEFEYVGDGPYDPDFDPDLDEQEL